MPDAQFPYAIKLTVDVTDAESSIMQIDKLLDGIQSKAEGIDFSTLNQALEGLSEGGKELGGISESLVSIGGALAQMSAAAPGITSIATSLASIKTSAGPAGETSSAAIGRIGVAADLAAGQVSRLQFAIESAIGRAQALGGVAVAPVGPVGPYEPTSADIVQAAGYTIGRRTGGQVYGTGAAGPIVGSAGIEDIAERLRGRPRESRMLGPEPIGPSTRFAEGVWPGVENIWASLPAPMQEFLDPSPFRMLQPYDRVQGRYYAQTRQIGLSPELAGPATVPHEMGHVAIDMATRMASLPGGEQMGADVQAVLYSASDVLARVKWAGVGHLGDPRLERHVAGISRLYPEGPAVQSEELIASVLGSMLTGQAGMPLDELGSLAGRLPREPLERIASTIRGLTSVDVAELVGTQPIAYGAALTRAQRVMPAGIGYRAFTGTSPSGLPYFGEELQPPEGRPWEPVPKAGGPVEERMGMWDLPAIRQVGPGVWAPPGQIGQRDPMYSDPLLAASAYRQAQGMGGTIFPRPGGYQFPLPPGAGYPNVAGFGPVYPTTEAATAGYRGYYGEFSPEAYFGGPGAPPPPTVPPTSLAGQPPQQPWWANPPPPPPSPGVTGIQPPWAHAFSRVTQEAYQEAWGQAGEEWGAILQAFPGVRRGPDIARVMSFEPSRRGGERDIEMFEGPSAQVQRTQQIVAATSAMGDFGRSIMRTAGYFLRWVIVWNVFEFVINGIQSMVREAVALEDVIARVAFIRDASPGQAREYVLEQYGAGAEYGMVPPETRAALPTAAAYGIDIAAGGQMRRAFGIDPAAGIQGLQQALYQTGAQTAEIQNVMAILYREAPNQAEQLLEVISRAGLLSRQLGASWEEIAYASVLTGRQMGAAPTEMTTAMARFAMRVPESLAPQVIQQLAQMDDPAMIRRMGPSGFGIVTQRGGTQAQIMVEMIRNLNDAMEAGIEPGRAFAELIESIADTPTEAFMESKAALATAWIGLVASVDEFMGLTEGLTTFFSAIARDIRIIAEGDGGEQWQWRTPEAEEKWKGVGRAYGFGQFIDTEEAVTGPALRQPQPGYAKGPVMEALGLAPRVLTEEEFTQQYFGQPEEPYPQTMDALQDYQLRMIEGPLQYLMRIRQYSELTLEDLTQRIAEHHDEFMQGIDAAIAGYPGTDEDRALMRERVEQAISTMGGYVGVAGGEMGRLTGWQMATLESMQRTQPEMLRQPFRTLGDITEAEFMRMLPRALEWEREAEETFGREFPEVEMDVAFEDSFKTLSISQEGLAKTIELLNDTMTGMWNIPAGQVPWIPMPTGGLDIVTGDGATGGPMATYTAVADAEITAMGTLTQALINLAGVMVMEPGAARATVEETPLGTTYSGFTLATVEETPLGTTYSGYPDKRRPYGPPPEHPQVTEEEVFTSYLPLISAEGPPTGHPQAIGQRRGTTQELVDFMNEIRLQPSERGATPGTRGWMGGPTEPAPPTITPGTRGWMGGPVSAAPASIEVNMTAYLRVDGRQIVTQVERIMIQDARVTMRSVS